MSLLAEELVSDGHPCSPIFTKLLMWESIITAGNLVLNPFLESGASPLTLIRGGSTALCQDVDLSQQVMTVRKLAFHLVDTILERSMSQQAEELVKTGQRRNLISLHILT